MTRWQLLQDNARVNLAELEHISQSSASSTKIYVDFENVKFQNYLLSLH
jgi:hypothetical protein